MSIRHTVFASGHRCLLAGVLGLVPLCGGQAQSLQVEELELALEAALRKIEALEGEAAEEEGAALPLESALADANREKERYKTLYRDLLLRVEALGVDTVRSDDALRERLGEAVRDRLLFEEENESASEQLLTLSESILQFLKNPQDAENRVELEAELRQTDEFLGFGNAQKAVRVSDIEDGRVVSFRDDLGLAVVNVGRRSGVRLGMPLSLYRRDRLIGTALVVDVREGICGAIVQEIYTEGDQIAVRDRIEPRTTID